MSLAILALGWALPAQAQELLNEAFSREHVVNVGGLATPDFKEIVAREVVVFVGDEPTPVFKELISREFTAVVPTAAPPIAITEFKVDVSPTGEVATLDWSGYGELVQRDVLHYLVYRSAQPFTSVVGMTPVTTVPAGTFTFTFTGLPAYQDQYYAVVPVDVLGGSVSTVNYTASYVLSPEVTSREFTVHVGGVSVPESREVISREMGLVVATTAPPAAIADIDVSLSADGMTATLDWSGYLELAQLDIVRYDIYLSTSPITTIAGLTRYTTGLVGNQRLVLENLPTNSDLYFAVVPVDALGQIPTTITYAVSSILFPEITSREYTVSVGGTSAPEFKEIVAREVTMMRPNQAVPTPVTGLNSGFSASTSTSAYRAIDLDWSNYNELTQVDVVRYRVYVGNNFFGSVTALTPYTYVPAGTQQFTLTGLDSRGIYYIAVVAEDVLGQFDPAVRAVSGQATPEGVGEVRSLAATSAATSLTFTWEAPENVGAFLTGYRVYFGGSLTPVNLGSSATSYQVNDLLPAHGYAFRITTVDVFNNESGGASVLAATLVPHPVPVVPTALDSRVVLNWPAVATPEVLKHYAIYISATPISDLTGLAPLQFVATDTSATISGLTNNQTYHFAVASVNVNGASIAAITSVAATPVPDTTGPRAIAVSPATPVSSSLASIDVTFSESLNAASITLADATLTGPFGPIVVTSASLFSPTVVRVTFAAQIYSGNYTLQVGPQIADLAGNFMDQDSDGLKGEAADDTFATTITVNGTNLADLVVEAVAISGSGIPGTTATVNWTIRNAGNGPATGPWTDQVALAYNGVITNGRNVESSVYSAVLAAGATVARSLVITVPIDGPSGNVYGIVKTDSTEQILEISDANNAALSSNTITVPALLSLSLSKTQITETDGPNAAVGTVRRNGDLQTALTVALVSNDPASAGVPGSVTIPLGQTFAEFAIAAVTDALVEATKTVQITATATGFPPANASLSVVDVPPAPTAGLALTAPATTILEGDSVTLTLTRSGSSTNAVTVNLSATMPTALSVPTTASFAAGASSTTFNITATQNFVIETDRSVTVNATAESLLAGQLVFTIIDDDTPTLALALVDTVVSETAGTGATYGTVTRDQGSPSALTVTLTNSNPSSVTVPATVTIPAGQTSANFPIGAVNNAVTDGDRVVALGARIVVNGTTVAQAAPVQLTVLDDDGPRLVLDIPKQVLGEGLTPAVNATVTRPAATNVALLVTLTSSLPAAASAPVTVTIPANATSITFPINTPASPAINGSRTVVFRAEALGFASSEFTVIVSDESKPDLLVSRLEVPVTATADTYASVVFRIENQGLAPALATAALPWTDRIYLSKSGTLADAVLAGQQTFEGNVPVGLFFERSVPVRTPNVVGDYYIVVETNADQRVDEITRANNVRVSATPIRVLPAYEATVQANIERGVAGQPVQFSGRALKPGGDPAPSVLVNIHILVRGTKRIVSALTDAVGNFSITWTPLPGEAGRYQIGAVNPGVTDAVVQDEFTILGVATDPKTLTLNFAEASSVVGTFSLSNLADVPLTGLTFTAINAPAGLTLTASAAPATGLGLLETVPVSFTASAALGSAGTGSFVLRITASDGVTHDLPVNWTVKALQPRLRAEVEIVEAAMLVGGQRIVPVTITNTGGAPSGQLNVILPLAPWLSLVSPAVLPSLAPGESTIVNLRLAPAADLQLTVYNGSFVINGAVAAASLNVPFSFRAVSDGRGTLAISVVDEFTYFTEAKPKVAGATVTLRDPFTAAEVAKVNTDASGTATFPNLPNAYYAVEVTAEKHAPAKLNVFVEASSTTSRDVFISYQAVKYNWTVTETEIQDRYKITIESTFETNVPVPVVVVEPGVLDLAPLEAGGQSMQVNMKFTNYGLIGVNNLRLSLPNNHPLYRFTTLTDNIGTLGAKQSITVPVIVERLDPAVAVVGGKGAAPARAAAGGGYPCGMGALYIYDYICGPGTVGGGGPIAVINFVGGSCPGGPGGGYYPGGGAGGGAYPVFIGSSAGDCDPCVNKLGGQMLECAIAFTPAGCPYGLVKSCIVQPNFKACVWSAVGCVAKLNPIFTVLDCYCGIDCFPKPSSGPGALVSAYCGATGATARSAPSMGVASGESPAGKSGSTGSEGPARAAAGAISSVGPYAVLAAGVDDLYATVAPLLYIFGSKEFFRGPEPEQREQVLLALRDASADSSSSGAVIDATEQAIVLSLPRPAHLTAEIITAFIARWNYSAPRWAQGIRDASEVPAADRALFISRTELEQHAGRSDEALARGAAYAPSGDPAANLVTHIRDTIVTMTQAGGSSGTCARVKIRIDQEAVMTRSAFEATLELANNLPDTPLTEVKLDLAITTTAGAPANERFAVSAPRLTNLTAINGSGTLAAITTGVGRWTIVPNDLAAPTENTVYRIGGTLSYRQGDQLVTIPLVPATVTVRPDAALTLKYFHQRDVVSDDPHTLLTETSEPYTLAVLIKNSGAGAARNLTITSAQPEIVDNEKGLLIDFKIIASELTEFTSAGLTSRTLTPSLTLSFGDIAPGGTKLGRWLLTSSLQGLFIDYSATFEHLDSLGDPRLSLIKSVEIHELIRQIADPQNVPAFLVNDVADLRDMPDTVHASDGTTAPVSLVEAASVARPPTSGDLTFELTTTMPGGWSYLRVPDPANGQFRLTGVTRSDGRVLALGVNAWVTDRTFIGLGQRPIRENILHVADFNSTGRYTLTYSALAPGDTTKPTTAVAALPSSSYNQIPVTWSGTDAGGLASYDIFVSVNGAAAIRWLDATASTGSIYIGEVGKTYAFYSRGRDATGNYEDAPLTPDASTTVNQVNVAPTLASIANQIVDKGSIFTYQLVANDVNANTVLTYRLGGSGNPSGAVIASQTGELAWQTTVDHAGKVFPFEVQVWDNGTPQLGAFRTFTVTVLDANGAPLFGGVEPQSIRAGKTLSLQLTATDADLPAQTLTYSLVGTVPAGLTINATTGLVSWIPPLTAIGSAQQIKVRVTDNGTPVKFTEFDVIITVLANLDAAFEQWKIDNFTAAQRLDPSIAADTADPNNNRRANLLEYALGQRPLGGSDPDAVMRTYVFKNSGDGLYYARMMYRRRTNDSLLVYRPEVSADRQTWASGANAITTISIAPAGTNFEDVIVEDRTPVIAGAPRYFQLKVSRPAIEDEQAAAVPAGDADPARRPSLSGVPASTLQNQ